MRLVRNRSRDDDSTVSRAVSYVSPAEKSTIAKCPVLFGAYISNSSRASFNVLFWILIGRRATTLAVPYFCDSDNELSVNRTVSICFCFNLRLALLDRPIWTTV